jgi:hypothetical protein
MSEKTYVSRNVLIRAIVKELGEWDNDTLNRVARELGIEIEADPKLEWED